MTEHGSGRRRHDFDLLRVLSFGTLIVYHASQIFGTEPWLLNSDMPSRLMDLISVASHPWRMSLLFLISGFVTSSLLGRKPVEEILRSRTRQLLLPFVLGVFLLVPPQVNLSNTNPFPDLSYWNFWVAYVLTRIRFEHMWFLAYLWTYIFVWSIIWPRYKERWPILSTGLASMLTGPKLFLVPIALLSLLRICLFPLFGETLVIINDFYSHVLYFSMFMTGVLLVKEERFWQEIDRQRWLACLLTLISLLALVITVIIIPWQQLSGGSLVVARIVRSMFHWCAIITLLAFAARIATRPNRVVTYLNNAVMTYYVVHLPVLIALAYYFSREGLLDTRSFLPLCILTALICAAIAEMKRLASVHLRLFAFRGGSVEGEGSKSP